MPTVWVDAGDGITEAADNLARQVGEFCHAVSGKQPFGSDDLGKAAFEGDEKSPGFARQRDGLLEDLAAAVNLLRGMGAGLVVSGGRYVEADGTIVDQLGGRRQPGPPGVPGGVAKYVLPQVAGGRPTTVPPPAIWLQTLWVLEAVGLGCPWPDGDIDGVKALRDAARTMGGVVRAAAAEVNTQVGQVTGSGYGEATDRFGSTARAVYGEGGLLDEVADNCEQLALYCQRCADGILLSQRQCVVSAIFVLTLIIYGSALGALTESLVLPLIKLEGWKLQFVLRVIREAVLGATFGGGLDGISQVFRGQGFDSGELLNSLWQGALAGGLMGGAHARLPAMLSRFTALAGLSRAMESSGVSGLASRFAVGGGIGTVAMATSGWASGHGWDWKHAAETGFGMAAVGAGTEVAGRFRPPASHAISEGTVVDPVGQDEIVSSSSSGPLAYKVSDPSGVVHEQPPYAVTDVTDVNGEGGASSGSYGGEPGGGTRVPRLATLADADLGDGTVGATRIADRVTEPHGPADSIAGVHGGAEPVVEVADPARGETHAATGTAHPVVGVADPMAGGLTVADLLNDSRPGNAGPNTGDHGSGDASRPMALAGLDTGTGGHVIADLLNGPQHGPQEYRQAGGARQEGAAPPLGVQPVLVAEPHAGHPAVDGPALLAEHSSGSHDAPKGTHEVPDRYGRGGLLVETGRIPDAAPLVVDAAQRLMRDLPEGFGDWVRVSSEDFGRTFAEDPFAQDAYAYARVRDGVREVVLNENAFRDPAALSERLAAEAKDGWTVPSGGKVDSVIYHEVGHFLADRILADPVLRAKLNEAVSDVVGRPYDAADPHDDPALRTAIEYALSTNGAEDPHQMIAEAFADHMLARDDARPLAKAVGPVIDEFLSRGDAFTAEAPALVGGHAGDGTLTGHPAGEIHFRAGTGEPHGDSVPADPPITWRDEQRNVRLSNGRFHTDPATAAPYAVTADMGPKERYTPTPAAAVQISAVAAERAFVVAKRDRYQRELEIKLGQIGEIGNTDAYVSKERLRNQHQILLQRARGEHTEQTMRDAVALADEILETGMGRIEADQLVNQKSEKIATIAAMDYATNARGGKLLTPASDTPGKRDTVDVAAFVAGRRPTLIIVEAKGGRSPLRGRNVVADAAGGRIRVQQGTRPYLAEILRIDQDLRAALDADPETRRQLKAALRNGTLRVEYHYVHWSRRGIISRAEFNINNPDGTPFSPTTIAGVASL